MLQYTKVTPRCRYVICICRHARPYDATIEIGVEILISLCNLWQFGVPESSAIGWTSSFSSIPGFQDDKDIAPDIWVSKLPETDIFARKTWANHGKFGISEGDSVSFWGPDVAKWQLRAPGQSNSESKCSSI